MFLKMFQQPGESIKKWTVILAAIYDAVNILVAITILIYTTVKYGVLGFFAGLIFGAIYFFLCLALTRFICLLYYCSGEMVCHLKSIEERIEKLTLTADVAEEQKDCEILSTEKYCTNCGQRINSQAKFCPYCGKNVQ